MLKKLFFNDFNAIRRHGLRYLLFALGCGLASFLILLLDAVLPKVGDTALFLANTLTALVAILLLSAAVLLLLSALQVFLRFYRNFFTAEGEITFLLPATRRELLLSKLLSGGVFCLVVFFAALLVLTVGLLLPLELLMRAENASFLSSLLRSVADSLSVFSAFDLLILFLTQTVLIDTAITVGVLFFQKKKALGAVGFYLLALILILLLRSCVSFLAEEIPMLSSLLSILISISALFGGYLITYKLFGRDLHFV